jgi:BirA family biotin operon repressor/biotin-[acetyl-CoA-carboxylase] ligase
MQSKQQLLLYLDQNRQRYVSGEELCSKLGITRTALWTSVRALRSAGYHILSEHGQGYRLDDSCELYESAALQARLQNAADDYIITVLPSIPSTNAALKEMAKNGAPTGTVLIAKGQSNGYGRKDRSFFSPNGGIYMSVLLRPDLRASDALTITTTAAVAVVDTIKQQTGRDAHIKWVNDVYMDGRKVCGILTESALTPDGKLDYAVLGIGVNIFSPAGGYPKAITNIAGAVYPPATEQKGQRSAFVVALLERLSELLPQCCSATMHTAYCRASFLPGRMVTVLKEDAPPAEAVALGIDEQYRLTVRYTDGHTESLFTGEVSVKEVLK